MQNTVNGKILKNDKELVSNYGVVNRLVLFSLAQFDSSLFIKYIVFVILLYLLKVIVTTKM